MDKVEITVKAGRGGDGAISFRREKYIPFGGPDGGDGGRGGNIYIEADGNVNGLALFRHKRKFKALPGKNGAGQQKHGRNGEDIVIRVPPGTVLYEKIDDREVVVADLNRQNHRVLVAKGGGGGMGNVHFATPSRQAPKMATGGEPGEERTLVLDLKLIADVGIVGYPNVGKSTLLSAVSAARPKTADYPFTTLEPVLGEVKVGKRYFIVAEIPGLIRGAHLGRGLGYDFLRHAERTKVLLHLLDGSSASINEDLSSTNTELALYKQSLLQRPQIVAINKIDLPEVQARITKIKEMFSPTGVHVYFISCKTGQGVSELMSAVADSLERVSTSKAEQEEPMAVFRPKPKSRRG